MVKNATENEIRMDYDYFMELAQVKPRSYEQGIKLIKQRLIKFYLYQSQNLRQSCMMLSF